MKLKITYFALALLISFPLFSRNITLKSAKSFDGTFINGEVVMDIRKYQFDVSSMLLGKRQDNHRRIGTYTYEGTKYSVNELTDIEQKVGHNQQLKLLLTQMREDFEKISKPFEEKIRDAKPILKLLVEQSIKLRNRENSLLSKWSDSSMANERELFEKHIQTIQDLKIFLIDLCNFLSDIVTSCPKALKQYNDWRKTITVPHN